MGLGVSILGARVCGPICEDPSNYQVDLTAETSSVNADKNESKRRPAQQLKGNIHKTPQARHASEEATEQALVLERLGIAADEVGSYEESERLFREAIQYRAAAVGATDESCASLYTNLGVVLAKQMKFEEAQIELQTSLEMHTGANNGSELSHRCAVVIVNSAMVSYEHSLAIDLKAESRSFEIAVLLCDDAVQRLARAERIYEQLVGDHHPLTSKVREKISQVSAYAAMISKNHNIEKKKETWDHPSPELAEKLEKRQEKIRAASKARRTQQMDSESPQNKIAKLRAMNVVSINENGDKEEEEEEDSSDDDWKEIGLTKAQQDSLSSTSPEAVSRERKRASYQMEDEMQSTGA